jgi:type IV secretion system protein TrbK
VRRNRPVIFGTVAIAAAAIAASVIVAARHDSDDRHTKFFGTSTKYPTTGGEKMKVDWQ